MLAIRLYLIKLRGSFIYILESVFQDLEKILQFSKRKRRVKSIKYKEIFTKETIFL